MWFWPTLHIKGSTHFCFTNQLQLKGRHWPTLPLPVQNEPQSKKNTEIYNPNARPQTPDLRTGSDAWPPYVA